MPSFMCKDIGIDCPFEAHGSTENELMRKFIDHAEPAHKMHVLSADVIYQSPERNKEIIFLIIFPSLVFDSSL